VTYGDRARCLDTIDPCERWPERLVAIGAARLTSSDDRPALNEIR
jgi:hypothetical protein